MIWPGMTISPPNFLTPRRLPRLSRPLRDEPPAFLCAISNPPRPSFPAADIGDPQHGLLLAVALFAAVIMPPLLLEHDDLVAEAVLDEGGADRGTVNERRSGGDRAAVADHQHVAERNCGAGLALELLDRNHIVLGDF